jgi:hypothetical protein
MHQQQEGKPEKVLLKDSREKLKHDEFETKSLSVVQNIKGSSVCIKGSPCFNLAM